MATAARHLVLAQPLVVHELAQDQRFFQGGERAPVRTREHRQQCLGEIARPGFHARGVTPESAQGFDAPVAVDQHQALVAVFGHRDTRDELAAGFDGARQRFDCPRLQ